MEQNESSFLTSSSRSSSEENSTIIEIPSSSRVSSSIHLNDGIRSLYAASSEFERLKKRVLSLEKENEELKRESYSLQMYIAKSQEENEIFIRELELEGLKRMEESMEKKYLGRILEKDRKIEDLLLKMKIMETFQKRRNVQIKNLEHSNKLFEVQRDQFEMKISTMKIEQDKEKKVYYQLVGENEVVKRRLATQEYANKEKERSVLSSIISQMSELIRADSINQSPTQSKSSLSSSSHCAAVFKEGIELMNLVLSNEHATDQISFQFTDQISLMWSILQKRFDQVENENKEILENLKNEKERWNEKKEKMKAKIEKERQNRKTLERKIERIYGNERSDSDRCEAANGRVNRLDHKTSTR